MRCKAAAPGFILLIAMAGADAPVSAQQQTPRTVLTIHWGAEDFPGTGRMDAAIQGELQADPDVPVNYFAEYLESEQFPAETASAALRDYIKRKFEGRHIDVVITDASASLVFALRYRDELFPAAPIVFLSVAVPQGVMDRTVPGITGVLNDTPFAETLDLALSLHPSTRRVFVVAQAPSAEGYDQRVRSALSRFSNLVELTFVKEPTVPALLATVKGIPSSSLILYTRYAPFDPAPNVYPDEVARLLADASPVPVYTVSDLYIGSGMVGGMVRAAETIGMRLGDMARQILEGMPPESIPIATVPTVPVFDWRQVKRWRIDPSTLPAESQLLFRTPTAWESYRWYIIGTFIVVGVQMLLITSLLAQRTRRRRAEATIRAREASLQTSYKRIRLLAGRLISAQETARASFARDLHDDICQHLATVSMGVDFLKKSTGSVQDPVVQDVFADLSRNARSAFEGIRRLSHELHPAGLELLGLGSALKSHAAEFAKRHNVQVSVATDDDFRNLTFDVAVCLFRIAEESLRNGLVHGEAHRFAIALTRAGREVQMTVTDDGRGFDLSAARRNGHGLGLVSMEERARLVGAVLEIVTSPRKGTAILVKSPTGGSSDDAIISKALDVARPIIVPEPNLSRSS